MSKDFAKYSKIPDIFHPASITPGSNLPHPTILFSPPPSHPLLSFPSSLEPAADLSTHSRAVGGTSLEADSLPPIFRSRNPQY